MVSRVRFIKQTLKLSFTLMIAYINVYQPFVGYASSQSAFLFKLIVDVFKGKWRLIRIY